MSEAKKPVVVLLMHNGAIKDVVCDSANAVTCVMVNIVSDGSPQEGVKKLNLTMRDGEKSGEFEADVRRLGVKHPLPGDTVVAQLLAAAGEDEYNIDHIEHVAIDPQTKRVIREDGKISVGTANVIERFGTAYRQEFGESLTHEMLDKYKPE